MASKSIAYRQTELRGDIDGEFLLECPECRGENSEHFVEKFGNRLIMFCVGCKIRFQVCSKCIEGDYSTLVPWGGYVSSSKYKVYYPGTIMERIKEDKYKTTYESKKILHH